MLLGVLFAPHPPILLPAIRGEREEARATLEGFERLSALAAELRPEVVICLTPHGPMFSDGLCLQSCPYRNGLSQFGIELGPSWAQDEALSMALMEAWEESDLLAVSVTMSLARRFGLDGKWDHGAAVPLQLLPPLRDCKLVCVSPGFLPGPDLYTAGLALRRVCEADERRILVLASGDLSHSHFEPGRAGPSKFYDDTVAGVFRAGRRLPFLQLTPEQTEDAAVCASGTFQMAFGALDDLVATFSLFSYEAPYGVGYLTGAAIPHAPGHRYHEEVDSPYTAAAWAAVEWAVRDRMPMPEGEYRPRAVGSADLTRTRAGAFVSLHIGEELRGCIGTLEPTQPTLMHEILYAAEAAATRDPRFPPVRLAELPFLQIKVDVLSPPEPVDSVEYLNPLHFGVIVHTDDGRRGVLLPDLPGITLADQQVSIARQKGGIQESEPYHLSRFTVARHQEL